MASCRENIDAECENIQNVLEQLPSHESLHGLSVLELAGVSTFLHNFFNGVENVLKQIFKERGILLPTGASWHRELLNTARSEGIISGSVMDVLTPYLAFRHFFTHGYSIDLDPEKLESLVCDADSVYSSFKESIDEAVASL